VPNVKKFGTNLNGRKSDVQRSIEEGKGEKGTPFRGEKAYDFRRCMKKGAALAPQKKPSYKNLEVGLTKAKYIRNVKEKNNNGVVGRKD